MDSTFVRWVKEYVLGVSPLSKVQNDYRQSKQYLRLLAEIFFYKFGTLTRPSRGLLDLSEREPEIDPWFEWMKRIQQYPDEDMGPIRGSFLLDWTQNISVAVYFANELRHPRSSGAVWVADLDAMGKILHRDMTVGEMLKRMEEAISNGRPPGCPLVFCPKKQIASERARNQDAIYMAQMDLRYDVAELWSAKPDIGEQVLLKLILPDRTTKECSAWLKDEGMTETYIYPDRMKEAPTNVSRVSATRGSPQPET